ncbi:FkbM family methyltransferase [Mucilaginibacter ginkgonis]|uniref:FkbM family methyltransferase n=1 Tax=Mucilaginibacter ginkgonis TaxID=2682091 RepID=A0A6I4IP42_9SPHI|nr:FkbM family methyltransferase [Mucilaginibacter ginkgonis]QQL48506.1 FkbM family methyltransferase [Mucilaginibacter ginkgonis]
MVPFRVQWSWYVLKSKNHALFKRELKRSSNFWKALALKFIPNLHKKPLKLRLKDGNFVQINKFMDLFIFHEIFIDGCYDTTKLGAKPVIVDIGANSGMFAIRMKQLYPDATIYCFEPFEENFEHLLQNTSQFNGVTCYKKGVAANTRSEKLYIHGINPGAHSIYEEVVPHHAQVANVDLVSINEIQDLTGITRADFLKVDCEGAEYEIINAMTPETALIYPKMVVELMLHPDESVDKLIQLGYQVHRENEFIAHAELPME